MRGYLGVKRLGGVIAALSAVLLLCPPSRASQEDPWKEMYILRLDGEKEAFNFQLTDMRGASRELAEFRGQVVLLTFWATFCPPCIEEMPALNRLHNKWRERGLVVVGVSMDDERDRVEAYVRGARIEFPVLWDEHLDVGRQYRVYALPTTYIVDRRGHVIGAALGARAWDSPVAHSLIASILQTS